MRDMVGYGGVKKVLISAHYSSYIREHSIYSFVCAIAAAGIRTRVRGCFPPFGQAFACKRLLGSPCHNRWTTAAFALFNIGLSNISFMVQLPNKCRIANIGL